MSKPNKTIITGQMGIDPFEENRLFHTEQGRSELKEGMKLGVDVVQSVIDEKKKLNKEAKELSEKTGLTFEESRSTIKERQRREREDNGDFGLFGIFLMFFMLPFAVYEMMFLGEDEEDVI